MRRPHTHRLRFGFYTTAAVLSVHLAGIQATPTPPSTDYTVLLKEGTTRQGAIAAITTAGGTITEDIAPIGVFNVRASSTTFARAVAASREILGVGRNAPIGRVAAKPVPDASLDAHRRVAFAQDAAVQAAKTKSKGLDPLDAEQWGLAMIRADKTRNVEGGNPAVLIGILDTGVDAAHPDLAPNLDRQRSRNFVLDIPVDANGSEIDGPCEHPSCTDPVGEDDNGHGTLIAGIVAAAANGLGISGVAPQVTLVDIRVGQDSGLVFIQPVVDGLMYAADAGIAVATLGFRLDPWVYNCANNPADTPESQAEQRTITAVLTRALNYAHQKGVTLIGQMGDGHENLGAPQPDTLSPTFAEVPGSSPYPRTIDNATCLQLPVEGPNVLGVSALGPSSRKADYSNYGVERISVSAPGGFFRDGFGTPSFRTNANLVLSTYPRQLLIGQGLLDANGNPTVPSVVKACDGTTCAYYEFFESTSAAAAHAAGVAALIVSRFGKPDGGGNWTLPPDTVADVLLGTAAQQACPSPSTVSYASEGRDLTFNATCTGNRAFNGFYGNGIVDAFRAVTSGAKYVH
jgi:subtilisin family serine protease